MRYLGAVVLALAPVAAIAQERSSGRADVQSSIERGVAFLTKDAQAWKEEHNCASCHHAGLVIWSLHEAKQRGQAVDESFLTEMTKWVAQSGDGKTGVPRPAGIPKALNTKAVLFALALAAVPEPDQTTRDGMKLMVETVKGDQTDNGSWAAWPETRPPIFGRSDETMTALAIMAVMPAASAGDETAKAVRDKGIQWLRETKSDDDAQSIALRLILWQRLGRPAEELQPLGERIRARQNEDGGWSQSKDMASDAWATGQALYALAYTGARPDDSAIARGQSFLIKTQRDDGSWPMTSRPAKPGAEAAKSLIPITGAGSAWAILGLARSN